MLLTRRLAVLAGLVPLTGPLSAQEGWYPLKDDVGRGIQNFRVPVELQGEIMALDNAFTLGSADADVTLIEVYDSNCSFCRRAADDVKAMTAADTDLAVSLINAPSLGLPSVQAARVEYAVKKLGGEAKVREFHARSMAVRGVFDGIRALELASDLGLDRKAVEDVADRPETGQTIVQAVRLANATNLAATPSWLIAGTAVIGWPGRAVMERIVKAVRDCDKPVCA
ncbi:MAG: thioredoxin domain-containing protein [Phreatobacter sp.]|nr:thioredoxin domain-containing protein [Phreatobacter sp.]